MIKAIIWPLARLTFFTALVRGGLLWLEESHQIYMDRWVASMIGAAESMAVQAPGWVGWLLAGAVGLLTMTVWEVCIRLSRREKKDLFPKADLERWRSNNEMKIWQAGCLWEGVEPVYPVTFKNPAYSKFSLLLSAAETGELDLVVRKPDEKFAHSLVSKMNLIDYIKKRNIEMPEFLIGVPATEHHQTTCTPSALLPNWPMKSLCYHVLENIDDSEEVIREIEAKARLGVLTCWGRLYSPLAVSQNHNPPREISPEHWDDYSLDYLRCVMHEDPAECCTEPRGSQGDVSSTFQDLQVNQQQAISIWPHSEKTTSTDSLPEFKISKLVRVVLKLDRFDIPDPEGKIGRFLFEIRQKAIYGTIEIWGRENCEDDWDDLDIIPRIKIPREYWKSYKINEYEFLINNGRTITVQDGDMYDATYSDLAISRDQARKAWPGANI